MMRLHHGVLVHALAPLLILTGMLGAGTHDSVAAQGSGGSDGVDFAAMTLTPADLEAAGLEGYRVNYGYVAPLDEIVALVAESRDLPEDEVRETLDDAGIISWYTSSQYLPLDEDDPQGLASREVSSYVLQFEDEQGAATGWNLLEDESGDETANDLDGIEGFGDEAEATRYRATDPVTGDVFDDLDLTIRLGAFHVGVRVTDWVGEEPKVAEVKALAERMVERVEGVLDDGGPGLGTRAVRLTGEEVQASLDAYTLSHGVAVQLSTESNRDRLRRQNDAADMEQTDGYAVWQHFPGSETVEDDVWYMLSILRFADAAAADDWLGGTEKRVGNNANFTDFRIDDDAPRVGDASVTYTAEWADSPVFYRAVALRIGTTVAVIDMRGPETPPAAAIGVMAEMQATCLEEDACPQPVAVPEELAEFLEDVQGTDSANDDTPSAEETPEAVDTPAADDMPAAEGGGDHVTLEVDDLFFRVVGPGTVQEDPASREPAALAISPGGTITLVNSGYLPHDFTIDALGIQEVTPQNGDFVTLTIPEDAQPGAYEFYCSMPGHKEAGMVGTLTIVGLDASESKEGVSKAQAPHALEIPSNEEPVTIEAGDVYFEQDRPALPFGTG